MADNSGRIRVTEAQAKDFNAELTDIIWKRRQELRDAFTAGDQPKIDAAQDRLRRLDRLRTQIYDLMIERGWIDG